MSGLHLRLVSDARPEIEQARARRDERVAAMNTRPHSSAVLNVVPLHRPTPEGPEAA